MTHRLALVFGAGQRLIAHLVTRRTLAVAAFTVAEMQLAVPQLFAFGLATEGLDAAHLPRLLATKTALQDAIFALEGGRIKVIIN